MYELYDIANDPDQVKNLAADPRHKAVVDELTQRVVEHHRECDSPAISWLV